MEQNKIITIIKRISKQDPRKGQCILSEPFVCLTNSFYFVETGEDADFFFRSVKHMINKSYELGEQRYKEQIGNATFASALQSAAAQLSISIVKESFNEKYFESQISRISIEDMSDEKLLEKYLALLDKKQLKEFLMLDKEGEGLYSISKENHETMHRYLNKECRCKDLSIPSMDDSFKDYIKYKKENPYYYFDYLSKEAIVSVLLKHINKNLDVAVFTAKALFYSDINFAYNCLTLLFYFQNYWGNKILNPLSLEEVEIRKEF